MINDITQLIRASVRPAISVIFAGTIAQVVVEQIPTPGPVWALLSGVILWWFSDKTIAHIKEMK